jgi:hypothetical protein
MDVDSDSQRRLREIPYLEKCIQPTGTWGKQITDVKILDLPPNMVANCLLVPGEEGKFKIVFYRWDYNQHNGWKEFSITLRYSDGATQVVTVPSSDKGNSIDVEASGPIAKRVQQTGRKIPRILFNLSPSLETRAPHVKRQLVAGRKVVDLMQCTSMYVILGDDEMLQLVKDEKNIPNFLEAYEAVIPVSYKADLMRYYLLYKFGGMYHDDKSVVRHSLDSDVFDSLLGKCDMFISALGQLTEISYLAARPGSPIVLAALNKSIENIVNRNYGREALNITGNSMFCDLLAKTKEQRDVKCAIESVEWRKYDDELLGLLPIDWSRHRIFTKKTPWKVPTETMVKLLGEDPAVTRAELSNSIPDETVDIIWERQSIDHRNWPRALTYYDRLWRGRRVFIDGNPSLTPDNITVLIGTGVILFVIILLNVA